MSMIYNTGPPALLHNLKHNKVLHEQALFLTVESADVPYVPFDERYELERLSRSSRSEEHTSELQSLMRISYAVFCLKKKKNNIIRTPIYTNIQQSNTI